MEYRPLTEQEIGRFLALEDYAFRSNPPRAGLDAAKLSACRGLFVGGELLAQLEMLPLTVRTGQGAIRAVGVGSVASAPEGRRRGHVDRLMGALARELRGDGVPLCVLYPFKRSFYGRMGWGTLFERRVYSGEPALFASFRPGAGGFVPVGAADIAELDVIYSGALRGRFGTLVRDEAWWRDEILKGWDGKPFHAFVWRDAAGRGRSYLVFRVDGEGRDSVLRCKEIAALDPEARAQLFAFFAGHQDQVATVRFPAPVDAPVNALLPDPLACTVEPHFMLRILDVTGALAGYGFPRGVAGRLVLGVRDAWLPELQGVYELELADGACAVRRLADDVEPDLSCDVAVLAQLYARHLRPRTAAAFGALAVQRREALDLAERAFAGLAPFSSDYF